jgi:hypothetical protein
MAARRKLDQRRDDVCADGLRKRASRYRFIFCSAVNGRIVSRYVSAVKKNSCFFEQQFLHNKTQGTQSTKQAAALLKPTKVNMNTLSTPLTKEEKHAHNEIAAVLSIMPGLGHIYKGHYKMGFLWMFLGMPVAIFVGIISILGTAGVGLLLPIGCWAVLAYDAYNEKDRRHHHHLTWDGDDESPD